MNRYPRSYSNCEDRHLVLYSIKKFWAESSAVFALGRIFLGPNLLPPLSSKYRVEYTADLPKREVGQIEWKKYRLPKVEGLPKCKSKVLIVT